MKEKKETIEAEEIVDLDGVDFRTTKEGKKSLLTLLGEHNKLNHIEKKMDKENFFKAFYQSKETSEVDPDRTYPGHEEHSVSETVKAYEDIFWEAVKQKLKIVTD